MGRTAWAAGLLLAAAPLAAQASNEAANVAASSAPAGDIGPRELSNFSINGTVTRSAEPPPASAPAATAAPTATAPPTAARQPAERPAAFSGKRAAPAERAAADPLSRPPTLSGPTSPAGSAAAVATVPALGGVTAPVPLPLESESVFASPLPWIVTLLLLAAGAVVYFGRQRQSGRYAAASAPMEFASPEARPTPRPQADRKLPPTMLRQPPPGTVTPPLRPPAALATPAGVVSSGLRPWLEVELTPSQAFVTDEQAAIAFVVTLVNSGGAPARDVAIETCLLNAGQGQDAELSRFYTKEDQPRDTIPMLQPLERVTLRSAVRLPREAVQEYEVEGRKLFMPMVAVDTRYRWSSGKGQSATSFLVGRRGKDDARLAPLRLDQGPKAWKDIAARRYEKGLRV